MNHAPGAGSMAQPVDQQASALRTYPDDDNDYDDDDDDDEA